MAETFVGSVEIKDSNAGNIMITLRGDTADILAGGNENGGLIDLHNRSNVLIIHLAADEGRATVNNLDGARVIELNTGGQILAGGNGTSGHVITNDKDGNPIIELHADQLATVVIRSADGNDVVKLDSYGNITLGGDGQAGDVILKNETGENTIQLHGATANTYLGGKGADGDLHIRDSSGQTTIFMQGDGANAILGGEGSDGDLSIRNKAGQETVSVNGDTANLYLGGHGADGDLHIRDSSGQTTVFMEGDTANMILGGKGADGDLHIRDSSGQTTVFMEGDTANMILGGKGADGDLHVRDSSGETTILLEGDTGDITLFNADCAEEFEVAELERVEPGTVMVLDQDGKLRQSQEAYDKKVAGVISGAGGYKPGIVLDKKNSRKNSMPIALVGKAFVKVDAQYSAIGVGDLLTTSDTPGCAMKVTDPVRAFGAVIGKALRPLKTGQGLIPIMIALQ